MLTRTELSEVFKALSDEKRLSILDLLKVKTMCACEIGDALQIAQSKLSYHMKILTTTGLVKACCDGKWTYYTISNSYKEDIIKFVNSLISSECDVEEADVTCCGEQNES